MYAPYWSTKVWAPSSLLACRALFTSVTASVQAMLVVSGVAGVGVASADVADAAICEPVGKLPHDEHSRAESHAEKIQRGLLLEIAAECNTAHA